jgi:hypothetical protein
MADWELQFIKLRYSEEHMRRLLGPKGTTTFIKINQDMVEDGMEVMIKSSGTDKLKAQKQAMEMAQANLIDPLSFFEDIGASDPKGRVERLLTFQQDPATYMLKYVQDQGTSTKELTDTLLGAGASGNLMQPPSSPSMPPSAQPSQPTPTDTAQVPAAPPVGPPPGSPRNL